MNGLELFLRFLGAALADQGTNYVCGDCDVTFTQESTLLDHRETVHG